MRKRSLILGGHPTSIALEEPFWDELIALAEARHLSLNALVSEIDQQRPGPGNLSSALRMHVLESLKRKISRA
jgi:predicted DNA-binding ribbon-helix-helix protein